MPADTFNIDAYGISGPVVAGVGNAYVTNGSGTFRVSPTSYTVMTGNRIMIVGAGPDDYSVYRRTTNGSVVENPHWNGTTWVGSSGTSYTQNVAAPAVGLATASGGYPFYHAIYYTLGTVKSVKFEKESGTDVIGIPTQGDTGTLAFDIEGVVSTITVSGQLYEATAATMSDNIKNIEALQTGSQYTGNPMVFWGTSRIEDSRPKPYFVLVRKFTYQKTEKDVNAVNYDLTLVRRAYSI